MFLISEVEALGAPCQNSKNLFWPKLILVSARAEMRNGPKRSYVLFEIKILRESYQSRQNSFRPNENSLRPIPHLGQGRNESSFGRIEFCLFWHGAPNVPSSDMRKTHFGPVHFGPGRNEFLFGRNEFW